ncbi:MAG: S8 family peptidase [Pseudomonadota bacterium]
MFSHRLRQVSLITISAALIACGGGGGGSGSSSVETPVPVPAPDPAPPPEPPSPPTPELFQISGTITASSGQAVDSDTNDPASLAISNDSIATAQFISNPVTLGGYVNQPGSGAAGQSQISGDTDDYFRVDLLEGQRITMVVAEFQQADADLFLLDTEGRILDFSIETGEVETLTAPADGSYIINTFAFSGGTNYILAVGNQTGALSRGVADLEIVPFQSVVKYRQTDSEEPSKRDALRSKLQTMGILTAAGGPGRANLMAIKRAQFGDAEYLAQAGSAAEKLVRIEDKELRARAQTLLAIKNLRQDPAVEFAEPNYRVRAMATPNDELYPFQWHYSLIDLPQAWDTTTGSEQAIIAVVDTGILSGHPDLQGQLVGGYDFVRDLSNARDGDGIDPNPEDPLSGGIVTRGGSHGTHVGGTVAAAGNNGIGVVGVAYGSRIMPMRALGSDQSGTSYDIEQAVRFAAGLANDSGTVPAQAASVINLSLGGAGFSQASQNLYQQVYESGVVLVAAAGNEASTAPSYPAAYSGVISVGAVDALRRRASYSNTGASIDITAPGGDFTPDLNGDGLPDGILSTDGFGDGQFGYTPEFGTSFSAPHVSGVIALMLAVNPNLSPQDIDALLMQGQLTEDLGSPGRDNEFGYGLISAQKAVVAALEAAGSSPIDNPFLAASSSNLNFSTSLTSLDLELRNAGRGELQVLSATSSESWLAVDAADTDASGLGLYQIDVDREGLDNGVYSASVAIESTVNDLTVGIIMSVGGSTSADVGVVYVLLYEQGADADEAVAQASASSDNGSYNFAFSDVPAGQYQIIAGSDADNDLLICDAGEACGAWITFDQPILLNLEQDETNINFPVIYRVSLPNVSSDTAATTRRLNSSPSPLERSRN